MKKALIFLAACNIILFAFLCHSYAEELKVSAYNDTKAQCDDDWWQTACGNFPYESFSTGSLYVPGVVAVSRDLFKSGWKCGMYVRIANKVFIISDKMGPRQKKAIDIYKVSYREARKIGVSYQEVTLLGRHY